MSSVPFPTYQWSMWTPWEYCVLFLYSLKQITASPPVRFVHLSLKGSPSVTFTTSTVTFSTCVKNTPAETDAIDMTTSAIRSIVNFVFMIHIMLKISDKFYCLPCLQLIMRFKFHYYLI